MNMRLDRPVLEVRDVRLQFGGNVALDGVSLDVSDKEVVGVVGPNGAGKTSLLNCINGFYKPSRGKISFFGEDLHRLKPSGRARLGLGRTFQNIELFHDATALENIMLGRHMHIRSGVLAAALHWGRGRRVEAEHRQAVEETIKLLEIESIRDRSVADLSLGNQKLVEIGRALAMEPSVILLDEPTSGMNREEKEDVARVVMRAKHEMGLTQVIIEHDVRFVSELCDRVIVLDFGRVIADGPPSAVMEDPAVITAYLGT